MTLISAPNCLHCIHSSSCNAKILCVTTAKSIAYDTAKEIGVPTLKRDVFLDSTKSKYQIKENLIKAINIAKEKGYSVAIGHVGAEGGNVTAQAISEVVNEVGDSVEFVAVSDIINK